MSNYLMLAGLSFTGFLAFVGILGLLIILVFLIACATEGKSPLNMLESIRIWYEKKDGEYIVEWKKDPISTGRNEKTVKAKNRDEAFKLATEKFPNPEFQYVMVTSSLFWKFGDYDNYQNPHFDQTKATPNQERTALESSGKLPEKSRPMISGPESSGWAVFHSFLGWIGVAIGLILLVVAINKESDELLMSAIFVFFAGVANFFAAFMINVQTDMRHYLKEIAATQKKMAESFERLEGRGEP